DNEEIQSIIRGYTKYQGKNVSFQGPVMVVRPLPKRLDFLHSESAPSDPGSSRVEYLLPEYCLMDTVPFRFTQAAFYLPSVIRRIRIGLMAESIRTELLGPCELAEDSVATICMAIS